MRPVTCALGSKRPMMQSASTVLPEPLAPTTARISPSCTERDRSLTTSCRTRGAEKNGAEGSYMSKPTVSPSTVSRWCAPGWCDAAAWLWPWWNSPSRWPSCVPCRSVLLVISLATPAGAAPVANISDVFVTPGALACSSIRPSLLFLYGTRVHQTPRERADSVEQSHRGDERRAGEDGEPPIPCREVAHRFRENHAHGGMVR